MKFAQRPRILVIAYGCDPVGRSERAAGWGLTRTLTEFSDPVVLVGAGKQLSHIRRWETDHPEDAAVYVGVPEPRWACVVDKSRVGRFLLYLAWLRRARRAGQRLHGERAFDIVYHATLSTYWLPSPVGQFGVPSVWGPVGGAVTTPFRLWSILGWRGVLTELWDMAAVWAASWMPSTQRTWREVTVRIVQNEETLARLPAFLRKETMVLNHVMLLDMPQVERKSGVEGILYVSPLESRKGARLAIRALAYTPEDVRLTVVGDGPERGRLGQLARHLGIDRRVTFLGQLPRQQVFDLLSKATAAVFTGLREEGGVALAEAMLSGIPVIVLANGGAATIARSATNPERIALIEPGTVTGTARRMAEAMVRFIREPPTSTRRTLDQTVARQILRQAFERAITMGVSA